MKQAFQETNHRVIAGATAWKVANALRDDLAVKGRAREALAAYHDRGLVLEADGAAATIRTIVDAWEQAGDETGKSSTLMVAKTNAQVRAISAEVRRRLRGQGQIVGSELLLPAVSASGQAVTLPLAQGDRVRFLTRATLNGGQIVNGTEGRIESIRSGNRVELTVATREGRIRFSPDEIGDDQGRARLAHAYASTIHLAQGMTVDTAVVWVTPGMDRHDIYVTASRARAQTQIVMDRKAVESSLNANLPLSERGQGDARDLNERLDYLATQRARARLKRTTQDFEPPEEQQMLFPALPVSLEQTQQGESGKRMRVREISLD